MLSVLNKDPPQKAIPFDVNGNMRLNISSVKWVLNFNIDELQLFTRY
jgi:hypothetical protein